MTTSRRSRADPDAWLHRYHTERPHLGYRNRGRRPSKPPIDSSVKKVTRTNQVIRHSHQAHRLTAIVLPNSISFCLSADRFAKPMYFIQYQPLKDKLKERTLSDREALPYLILFFGLPAASGMIAALSAAVGGYPVVENSIYWDIAGGVPSVLITIGGIYYSYVQNGRKKGFDLIQKFCILGWVVGIRCSIVFFPILVVGGGLAAAAVGAGSYCEGFINSIFIFLLLIYEVVFYQRLGRHIRDTRNTAIESGRNGI